MAQSRQLAAIVFTDIVGYTALMGEDEEKAFELLRKNRKLQKPLIEQYGGRWIKELGDGVLASFSTVSDAVNAAIKIQEACHVTKEFLLRIGIHHGEVVFEEEDVFGDAVNIASRIQALAPIGGIWVSESVHSNISNKRDIKTKFVRAEVLKNVKEPVSIYEVLTNTASPSPVLQGAELHKKRSAKSLAVLPFTDMSPTHDQEYLGDGLAEELINVFSQFKELKVIGRTSSFSFKDTKTDIKTIGKTLSAETILEGSVQKAGNRVRITAQLIDAADGYHIWSQRYDREMDDIFALQDDICYRIAQHLKLTLLDEHEIKEENRPTNNSQAYELFLKGDFYSKKYTPNSFEKAIDCFKKALELDPNYADAWSYLGSVHWEMHRWLYLQKERIKTFIYCVNKAISIDKTNAEAHFQLALYHFNYSYDWEAMEKELALAKKYARTPFPIHLPLEAWIRAMIHSDFDSAVLNLQKGIANDPLNSIYQFHLAQINLYGIRNYKKTISILNNIIDLGFPGYAAWRPMCLSYLFEGQYEKAEEYARRDFEASEGKGHGAANLIISLAAAGKQEEAEQLYHFVKETLPIPQFPEFLHVKANAWLGKTDDAFDYLDKAIEARSFWLFTLKVSPEWDPLRSDPRFRKVLKQMNFPE
jgi:TolB-like protein/class 3 adenylate cyclase